jgi:hypothetical protein
VAYQGNSVTKSAAFDIRVRDKPYYRSGKASLKVGGGEGFAEAIGKPAQRKARGVYVIHSRGAVLYVGKTSKTEMDFHTRLYRHATESASGNSYVYQHLWALKDVKVTLLGPEAVRWHFERSPVKLGLAAMIDVLEQVLIHYLRPPLNEQYRREHG